jgi:hypothetical protein
MVQNLVDAAKSTVERPFCTLEMGRAHVDCIQAVHQTATIRQVPDQFLFTATDGQRSIAGIREAIERTFQTGELFSKQKAQFC